MEDFAAIDVIQKAHHKQLGFFPRGQMEGYINGGWVIVAEAKTNDEVGTMNDELKCEDAKLSDSSSTSSFIAHPSSFRIVGYCASRDRWLEKVNSGQYLPQPEGKHDISRLIESTSNMQNEHIQPTRLLAA